MTDKLLPCPFCADPMEDRGYGAVHINGKGCGIGDLAVDPIKWNRRDFSPATIIAGVLAGISSTAPPQDQKMGDPE
jgi:hypothetical protein